MTEDSDRPPPIIVPIRIREGDQVFTWFSTLAVFGATGDVTLEELVVESFFPADEVTRQFVKQVAATEAAAAVPGAGTGDVDGLGRLGS